MIDPELLRAGAKASAAVSQLAITVSLAAWLGKILDHKFGLEPWLTLLFTLLGFALSLLAIALLFRTDDPLDEPFDDST